MASKLKYVATCELCGVDFEVEVTNKATLQAEGHSIEYTAPKSHSEEEVEYACASCSDEVTQAVQSAILLCQAKKDRPSTGR